VIFKLRCNEIYHITSSFFYPILFDESTSFWTQSTISLCNSTLDLNLNSFFFRSAEKKSIIDYLLLDPAEKLRTNIMHTPSSYKSSVIRAPVPWKQSRVVAQQYCRQSSYKKSHAKCHTIYDSQLVCQEVNSKSWVTWLSFAQSLYFLEEVCLIFPFWMTIHKYVCFLTFTHEISQLRSYQKTHFPPKIYKLSTTKSFLREVYFFDM
jgi:hypothetical protein